jgi:ubiquitin-like protein ATG12
MSHNPLVSESESSSACASPSLASTEHLPTVSQVNVSPLREPTPEDDPSSDDNAIIKNQMLKSKITMATSMILQKLPQDTKKVLDKITEPSSVKITVRCQAIGSTPVLSPNVFKISYHQPMATLIKFIMKKLRKSLPQGATLYCYVNNSFAPAPDEIVGCLHDHFANGDELMVNYCTVVAFG